MTGIMEKNFTKVYKPAKCSVKLPDDLDQDNLVSELKIDGSRYVMYVGYDPTGRRLGTAFLSRRESSKDGLYNDKAENVPHITEVDYEGWYGTVLDGEVHIPGEDFYTVSGIMNSLPEEAIAKQKADGMANRMVVFTPYDCLAFKGEDVTHKPDILRRTLLDEAVAAMNIQAKTHLLRIGMSQFVMSQGPFLKRIIRGIGKEAEQRFKDATGMGGEGLVIKDLHAPYGKGWYKMKKSFDTTCIVMGTPIPGKGKYKGQIGSLRVGVLDEHGLLIEVAAVSGYDDAERQRITDDYDSIVGTCVDVIAETVTKGNPVGRLRNPTFARFRIDVSPSECTVEKLKADFAFDKAKPKRNRD